MSQPSDNPRTSCRKRRLWRIAVIGCFFLCGATAFAWGLFGSGNEKENRPRDPVTGILAGTEARDLGPKAENGATTAVLLVHGFLDCREDFADLGDRLAAKGFHVRELRLPGHGTTPADFARQTPANMFRAVVQEFDALKSKYAAVRVVGFSMGGALATLLTAHEGLGGVDRLALAAPYYGVTYRWFYVLPVEGWNAAISWAVPYVQKSPSMIQVNRRDDVGKWFTYENVPTKGTATLIQLGKEARRADTLSAIRCPVLMVMSEGDHAASPMRAKAAFAEIASAQKKALWLTRSNHSIFWDWDREEVKSAIVDFLSE